MKQVEVRLANLSAALYRASRPKESNVVKSWISKTAQSIYTVKSGDTLESISGKDIRYQRQIEAANPNLEPDKLQPGQQIKLPQKPLYPNKSMNYSPGLVEFIKRKEGRPEQKYLGRPFLQTYDDQFGNLTIGWGHKLKGDAGPIDASQAEKFLHEDLSIAADFIRRNVDTKLLQYQFDALASLVFNAGGKNVVGTDLFRAIDEGRFADASRLFPTTMIGPGQRGLQIRRTEEAAMFTSGTGTY